VCALTFDMRGVWRPQAGTRPLDGRVRALPRAEAGRHGRETLGFLHSDYVFVLRVGLASTSAPYVGPCSPHCVRFFSPAPASHRPVFETVRVAGLLPEASSSKTPQRPRREATVFAGWCLDLALAAEGRTARTDCGHTGYATVNDDDSNTCKRSNV
jgi:hypothetical protein